MLRRFDLNLDQLNIILMFVSLFLSYYAPFDLILISYAFLGPAHYLTEIQWLDKRNYFLNKKTDILPIGIATTLLIIFSLLKTENVATFNCYLFVAIMLFSVIITFSTSQLSRYLYFCIASLMVLGFMGYQLASLFYVFVPTLVHVYLFTGLFILYGAIKKGGFWGLFSFLSFICCGACYFFVTPLPLDSLRFYGDEESRIFVELGEQTLRLLNVNNTDENLLRVMAFISFAYTYHYLNWFSKTRVIRWHEIHYSKAISLGLIYFLAVSLYIFNYQLGLMVLLFLSLLHVVLEFPLNLLTARNVIRELAITYRRSNP